LPSRNSFAILAKKRRMSDLREQLAALRERVARINQKYVSEATGSARPASSDCPSFVEEFLSGQQVETEYGRHFECEKLYDRHRRHGSSDIGALADLPSNLFDSISGGDVPDCPPGEWAFLDTETTGLSGGSGTCAFLVGVGRITPEGFCVRQFFMRDFAEEPSLLHAVAQHLAPLRRPSRACNTSICCTAQGVCGVCGWRVAAW
jgi:uncharacterized protein YprB with RNaseH-like and TPR domain